MVHDLGAKLICIQLNFAYSSLLSLRSQMATRNGVNKALLKFSNTPISFRQRQDSDPIYSNNGVKFSCFNNTIQSND